jgi:hypothetical protein
MLAADWNEIQVRARTELRTHDHTGDATRIPRDGIADKAIDGSKVDPKATHLKSLASRPSRSPAPASSPTSRPPSPASAAISAWAPTPRERRRLDRVVDILGAPTPSCRSAPAATAG